MKKYFIYQIKKNILPLSILALLCIIAYVLPVSVRNYSTWNAGEFIGHDGQYYQVNYTELYTTNIIIVLGVMSGLTPIYMFAYKMNRRSVDMYYSLPLSKTKILIVHFAVGFLGVIAAFTLSYWLGVIVTAVKVRRLAYINFLWIYLACIIPAFTIYSTVSFLYTRANSMIDGIIFAAAGFLYLAMPFFALESAVNEIVLRPLTLEGLGFTPAGSLISIASVLGDRLYRQPNYWDFDFAGVGWRAMSSLSYLLGRIICTLLSIGAAVALILTEKDGKAENCLQISQSVFGFKIAIPLNLICLGVILESSLPVLCALAFAAFIATVVWKRTIKIGKRQAILLAIYIAVAVTASLAIHIPSYY